MIRKNIFVPVLFSVFMVASVAYAGRVELTTYYPAPTGEYNSLQAQGSCVGTACTAANVTPDNLRVMRNTVTGNGGDLTVENTATITNGVITNAAITDANVTGTTTSNILVATTATNTNLTVTNTTQTGRVRLTATGTPAAPIPDGTIWIQ